MTISNAEAQLCNLLGTVDVPRNDLLFSTRNAISKAVVAAGWRPPARELETVEELDALPTESVVRDFAGNLYERRSGSWHPVDHRTWESPENVCEYPPLTVLHEGGA